MLLAGSQLGSTVGTLALGAITKPAVHHWLTPAFEGWGAPLWLADVAGFVLALIIVTFLHLVVGEMAPTSWAIAIPEKSATLLAIPVRGFVRVTRPALNALNRMANWCLIKAGVAPVDQLGSRQDADVLRHLVEHSATAGTLDERYHGQLTSALELEALTGRTGHRMTMRPVVHYTPGHSPWRVRCQNGNSCGLVASGCSARAAATNSRKVLPTVRDSAHACRLSFAEAANPIRSA